VSDRTRTPSYESAAFRTSTGRCRETRRHGADKGQGGTTGVLFTDTSEYLEELAAERDNVKRGIVRITQCATPAKGLAGAVSHATVESAARIDGGDLVRFRGYVGDLWGHANDAAVLQRASELTAEIEAGVKAIGLEVRAGLFEELGR
jgi:hypothetical protein